MAFGWRTKESGGARAEHMVTPNTDQYLGGLYLGVNNDCRNIQFKIVYHTALVRFFFLNFFRTVLMGEKSSNFDSEFHKYIKVKLKETSCLMYNLFLQS